VAAWIDEYDILRRHLAIGMISPAAFEASHDPGGMNAGSRLAKTVVVASLAAAHPRVRRAGYGPAPPASRLLRIADATALTPEPLRTLGAASAGAGHACPRKDAQHRDNITRSEVSTVTGDCHPELPDAGVTF
jgi:hypothetical protein